MDNHYKMFSCPPSLTRRKRPYGHVYSRMLWNATRNPVVALFVPNIIYPPTPTKKKYESFCCGTKYNKILSDNDNKYENHTWNYRERGFVRTPLEKLKIYENWPWPPPPPINTTLSLGDLPLSWKKKFRTGSVYEDSCKCCSGVKSREVYTSLSKGKLKVGARLIRKLDRETKTRRKKKDFGYVYANLCKKSPPPPAGSDAYVLTLYTPT